MRQAMETDLLQQAHDLDSILSRHEKQLQEILAQHKKELQEFDSALLDDYTSKLIVAGETLKKATARLQRTQKALEILEQQHLLESLDGVLQQLHEEESQQKSALSDCLDRLRQLLTTDLKFVYELVFQNDKEVLKELEHAQWEAQSLLAVSRPVDKSTPKQQVDHMLAGLLKVHPLAPKQA